MDKFGLYVIATQPALPYTRVAEICVQNNIKYLQLREKELSDSALLRVAHDMRAITRGTQTRFVINDRADIARLCDADLLHLGQDDLRVEDARKIVGDMPIGLSTHSLDQARRALEHSPEYIGFGPVYATTTKKNPDPTVGTKLLGEVLKIATVPVVAIGGIFPENIKDVLGAGAQNLSLVRYLMGEDMESKVIEIQNYINICTKVY